MLRRGVNLYQAVATRLSAFPKGRVLDVATGGGVLAKEMLIRGYEVAACDIGPKPPWDGQFKIKFTRCDLNAGLPFADQSFDYVCALEIIEHIENPLALCRELNRVLRSGGRAIVSTPNILKMRSRVRFLLEGNPMFFERSPIEWDQSEGWQHVHVHPIRLQELEYYLYKAGLELESVFTSERSYGWRLCFPLELLIRFMSWLKVRESQPSARTLLARLYSRILTDDLLYGVHLIVCARRV